jgi:hypothetical protein
MSTESLIVNIDLLLKPRRSPRIEFWNNNGDGTCTRLADGLILTFEQYNQLPGAHELASWTVEADTCRGDVFH